MTGKPPQSQWDFGELFPPGKLRRDKPAGPGRRVLSVSELTTQVKRLLEKQVGSVWVTGEITNLRAQSSGHMYFTLKDAGVAIELRAVPERGGDESRAAAGRPEGPAARRRDGL